MIRHLLFYDGTCPLCNRAIRFVLAADKKRCFYFAPLNGTTAKEKLAHLRLKNPSLDTLVLLEKEGTEKEALLIEGRGALRILWLLGGKYALIGWLSFLPPFFFDACYRVIARYRFRLFRPKKGIEDQRDDHFLP
jgi:predicted DCC family thiol-disulfide oxidoreductase YuxK